MTVLLHDVTCPKCGRSDSVEDVTDVVRRGHRVAFCADCSCVFAVPDRPRLVTYEARPRKDLE